MPSPVKALDLISTALRHIGVLAGTEAAEAQDAVAGLAALNDLLESWSTEGLAVWGSAAVPFNAVAGQALYTVGVGGNWALPRPVTIMDVYTTYGGVDYVVEPISQAEYDAIALKTLREPLVQRYCYVNDYPLGLIYLYPTPSQAVPIVINASTQITQVPTLATTLSYPPGYARALQWNLAMEIAPQFGVAMTPAMLKLATESKARIKKSNYTSSIARFDNELLGSGRGGIWQRGY